MKKSGLFVLALVLLSGLLGVLAVAPPQAVHASVGPNTVATSTSLAATELNFQGRVFHANGFYWVFYFDGTSEGYKSSSSGSSWSAETTITSSCVSASAVSSFFVSGTTVYMACNSSTDTFYVDTGTLGSGTITWGTESAAITKIKTSTGASYPVISTTLDSNGKWWVVTESYDGTDWYAETWSCSSSCLTSTNWSNSNVVSMGTSSDWPVIVALTSGKVAVVWGDGALTVETFSGSAWSSAVGTTATDYISAYGSCVAIGDTIECALADLTDKLVVYLSAAYNSNSPTWSAETNLSGSLCTGEPDASIATDGSSHLGVYFTCEGTSTYYTTSANSGSTWSSVTTDSNGGETTASYVSVSPSTDSNGDMQAIWTSGSASPYNVRFSDVNVFNPDVTLPLTCTASPSGLGSAHLPLITVSGGSPSPSSFTCDGTTHDVSIASSSAYTLANPAAGSTSQWVFKGNGTSSSDTGHGTSCASGTCTALTFTDYQEISESWQIVAEAQSKFDAGLGITFTGEQSGTASLTVCSITTTSAATDLCTGWNDNGTAVQIPGSLTGTSTGTAWSNQGGTTTDTPTLGGQTVSYEFFKGYDVTNGTGILKVAGDHLGSPVTYTKGGYLDAGSSVEVTGTSGCSYTLSGPSYVYQFGSSPVQAWLNTTGSSFTDGTSSSPPYVSFSAMKASAIVCVGLAAYNGASVSVGGASVGSTWSYPQATFSASGSITVTFSVQTPSSPSSGCCSYVQTPAAISTTSSTSTGNAVQSFQFPPYLVTFVILALLLVLASVYALSKVGHDNKTQFEEASRKLNEGLAQLSDAVPAVDLDLSFINASKSEKKKRRRR